MRRGLHFALASALLALGPAAAAEGPRVIAPLTTEGYLWAGPLPAYPTTSLQLELGYLLQTYDVSYDYGIASLEDPEMHSFVLSLRGEYTFLGQLTLGFELPALVTYSIAASGTLLGQPIDWDDDGADFGNLRLHLRWMALEDAELGLVLTAAFRVWLPTNTFLEVEVQEEDQELLEMFAEFEPTLALGWGNRRFSALLVTGPKFFVLDDADDFSCWGIDLVLGASPAPSLDELELVLELNMLFELDDDDAPSEEGDDQVQAIGLGLGVRYAIGAWRLGLGLRIGLHEHAFYMGQLGLGLTLDYSWGS